MSEYERGDIITTAPGAEGTSVLVTDLRNGASLDTRLVHDDFLIVTAGRAFWVDTEKSTRRDGWTEHTIKVRVPPMISESDR